MRILFCWRRAFPPFAKYRITLGSQTKENVGTGLNLGFPALELVKVGLSCKANKCSDVRTGDLGVLPTHEKSSIYEPAQPDPGEFHPLSIFDYCPIPRFISVVPLASLRPIFPHYKS